MIDNRFSSSSVLARQLADDLAGKMREAIEAMAVCVLPSVAARPQSNFLKNYLSANSTGAK